MGQDEETDYVDLDAVRDEVAQARRLCTEHGWPVIDVTRRSIEETAASIIQLLQRTARQRGQRRVSDAPRPMTIVLASASTARRELLRSARGSTILVDPAAVDRGGGERNRYRRRRRRTRRDVAEALAELKALQVSPRHPGG